MRLLDLPIRLLLVATFGLLPLLCCCGSAQAVEADPVAAERSCCATEGEKPAETPEHDCDCETRTTAMERQTEATPAPPPVGELPLLPPAPLPELIASAFADAAPRPPAPSEVAVPAAPTLRTLSVLLLT